MHFYVERSCKAPLPHVDSGHGNTYHLTTCRKRNFFMRLRLCHQDSPQGKQGSILLAQRNARRKTRFPSLVSRSVLPQAGA